MNQPTVRTFGLLLITWTLAAVAQAPAGEAPPGLIQDLDVLTRALGTPVKLLRGEIPAFTVTIQVRYKDEDGEQEGELRVVRADAERFGFSVSAGSLRAELLREAGETRLVVPPKGVALVGKGAALAHSPLDLEALVANVLALDPKVSGYSGLVLAADPGALALLLQQLGQLERVRPAPGKAKTPAAFVARRLEEDELTVHTTAEGTSIGRLTWDGPDRQAAVTVQITEEATLPAASTEGLKVVAVDRPELELALGRGLVRAADILYYMREGEEPEDEVRKADVARLLVAEGQRVAFLGGTPYQIGYQHGKLLAAEARRLCDAVLYCSGLAWSIEKKEWFLDVIRGAFQRLKPHIPAEYLEEMRGVAAGSGIPLESVQLANVFPALVHCSGFVLLPQATATGKLYHGRVLDYMTEIGLQRDAVIFVVKKDRVIPFANVGYAGFVGSVTGMNARKVCFGEMGGGGVGQWDGTPMPILLRMGLERAGTLDQAVQLLRDARRTCEYYYLVSDAKVPDAVGVYATPERIEFLKPGQAHPRLPKPVEHCVLMSAGKRYEALVSRVRAKLGRFTATDARGLMDRPVAMKSNLHNVLFDPMQLSFYVAHARGSRPAYKQDMVRYDLDRLLKGPKRPRPFPKVDGVGTGW